MASKKIKTQWDLSVFYKSTKDPQIEADQIQADQAYRAFAKKYTKDKSYLTNPKALAQALSVYEKLIALPSSKADFYAFFRKDLNSEDKEAEALLAKIDDRGTKRSNQIIFFTLEIGKIPKERQKRFLKSEVLKPFRYLLKSIFDDAQYALSEKEEKILSLKSDVSQGRWVQLTENILNKQTVLFKKEQLPLPKAEMSLPYLPKTSRHKLYSLIRDRYEAVSDVAEGEINAIYTNKKINDELRGYKQPYEATIRGYENEEKSVLALVDAVSKSNAVSHRFYKVKAKLLGEKSLTYADRAASIGSLGQKISFEKAVSDVYEVFGSLKPEYADIAKKLVDSGRVDVYPKKGKAGGAFCAHGVNIPTFVFLNHVDTFDSFKTLAHEMGHAVHSELSKAQRPFYEGYSTSTAETASTFFEYAALHSFVDQLPNKDRIIALHDIIQDDIATIFRQIACFNFEKSLHEAIRAEGYVPKQKIAQLMNAAMQSYLGKTFSFVPEDGYFFVTWSHVRRFFYVYSYAYGQLISKTLHKKLQADSNFIDGVHQFLTSGGSMSPEDIFGSIGVNTRSSKVFEEGIAAIEKDVEELERLVK